MADTTPKSYSADPTLYLYTSLTAGSSHIITATSRLETILKANKIPFTALDVATDEKARMLWGRRSKGKKLPGLVKFGSIVGDLEEVEEWNEYGELKQQIGSTPVAAPTPNASATTTPSKPPTTPLPILGASSKASSDISSPSLLGKGNHIEIQVPPATTAKKDETPLTMAMRQAGAEAAKKANERKGSKSTGTASSRETDVTTFPEEPKGTNEGEDTNEINTKAGEPITISDATATNEGAGEGTNETNNTNGGEDTNEGEDINEAEDINEIDTKASEPITISDVTATNEGEAAVMKVIKPQEQDPLHAKGAGSSVGD